MLDRINQMNKIANEILILSRNTLLVNLRFLDSALSHFRYVPYMKTVATDGLHLYYNPVFVLGHYKENNNSINRMYLHLLFHCIYRHMFVDVYIKQDLWNLACDIAVENTIIDLQLKSTYMPHETQQQVEINKIKNEIKIVTAEKIYRYLLDNNLSISEMHRLQKLFKIDDHEVWYLPPEQKYGSSGGSQNNGRNSQNDGLQQDEVQSQSNNGNGISMFSREEIESIWKTVSEHMQMDLETFSKNRGTQAGSLIQNIAALNREKYDYSSFLKKFAVMGEVMKINDDEFDYIFYTYGLKLYENMPLIEPLEYKEEKRVKEFVIAIDTSGSVQGELVQKFVTKTFNILKSTESFFTKINIHIIQCDTVIQEDAKITSQEEFNKYLEIMDVKGLGGTDFRPVFEYVDQLIHEKEFRNLKGLIYFTDGYGVFPKKKPDYNTAFVFIDDEYNNYDVPPWAIKLILQTDEINNSK